MAERTRFTVIREGRLLDETGQPFPRATMDTLTNELADALWQTTGVEDQGMDVNLKTRRIEMYVDIEHESVHDAIRIGHAAIRSALHAVGIATPAWDYDSVQVDPNPETILAELAGGGVKARVSDDDYDLIEA